MSPTSRDAYFLELARKLGLAPQAPDKTRPRRPPRRGLTQFSKPLKPAPPSRSSQGNWFSDPSRALCLILAGTPSADAPLIGMCDSARCPQATHHQRHRAVWAGTVSSGTVFLGQLGRTRKTEHARLQGEIDRAQRVVDAIDAAQPGTDPAEGE